MVSTEEKSILVKRYQAGESVSEICASSGVPRSTFYTWIKPYTITTTDSGYEVSHQEFIKMKQKLQKLEQKLEIMQKSIALHPLRYKKNYKNLPSYTANTASMPYAKLCASLVVLSITTSFAEKMSLTAYDKRRAEMKELIQKAFDESQQRFGANRIVVVLAKSGYPHLSQICGGADEGNGVAKCQHLF